jgi:hypothetical protein
MRISSVPMTLINKEKRQPSRFEKNSMRCLGILECKRAARWLASRPGTLTRQLKPCAAGWHYGRHYGQGSHAPAQRRYPLR